MARFVFFLMVSLTISAFSYGMRIRPDVPTKVSTDVKERLSKLTAVLEYTQKRVDDGSRTYTSKEPITYRQTLGTLIGPRWLLSCAHGTCLMKGGWATVNGKRYLIESVHTHPDYSAENNKCDFALVKLQYPVEDELEFPDFQPVGFASHADDIHLAVGSDRYGFEFTETCGLICKTLKVVGEISKMGTMIGVHEFDEAMTAAGNDNMAISTNCREAACWDLTNFVSECGDSGGGLFDSQGHLLGVTSNTLTIDNTVIEGPEYQGPILMQVHAYPVITEEIFGWIQQTMLENADVAPDAIHEPIDPSHGRNVRDLLANPMVPAADAQAIADLLRGNLRQLDGSAGNSNF